MTTNFLNPLFLAGMLLLGSNILQAQTTKTDSGWISLFNGTDFTGLYIRTNGGTLQDPTKQTSYKIENGTIHAASGTGHLATKAVFSRYQMRVQYKYAAGQSNPNAGLQYHIDSADFRANNAFGSKNADVPYFFGEYVTSIEFQTYRGDAGAFLGIMNIWVTAETKGDANHTWKAGGTLYTAYPSSDLAPRRIYRSVNAAPDDENWVQMEGRIYGADSVIHIINGVVVMKGKNLKHNRALTVTSNPTDPNQTPLTQGHIGLQVEGADVFYRNFEIRLLRNDGTPIIPGCMNPQASNFNPLANEDNGTCKGIAILSRGQSLPKAMLHYEFLSGNKKLLIRYLAPSSNKKSSTSWLFIRNALGKEIRKFDLSSTPSGEVIWDRSNFLGDQVGKGTYYLELRLQAGTLTKSLLLR